MSAYLEGFPEYGPAIMAGRSDFIEWQILRASRAGNFKALKFLMRELYLQDRSAAFGLLLSLVLSLSVYPAKAVLKKLIKSSIKFVDAQ